MTETCIKVQTLFDIRPFMPTAQQGCLRAACLRRRPREYKLFWTGHGLNVAGARNASSKGPKSAGAGTEGATGPSLLEELFPEEGQPKRQAPKERDIPRLDVRTSVAQPPPANTERRNLVRRLLSENRANPGKLNKPETEAETTNPLVGGVLMLRNASRWLVEDDFTRLIPQGLHIEGWPLDRADIVKIVPGRNTSTLERENFYFILFRTRNAMNAYRTHVNNLHRLISRHSQSSLTSPIPPPPGDQTNDQDIDSLMQSYTLIPPTRPIQLLPLPFQISRYVQDVIKYLGYPDIVNGPLKEPYVVLMRLEGPQVPITMITGVLRRAEEDRRIPWDKDFGNLAHHTWLPKPKNISTEDRIHGLETREKTKAEQQQEADELEEDRRSGARERRRPRNSYLFGFHSHDAALTFVQYWHRRPIELAGFRFEHDEMAPVADVELLW
jgi:hypothetical protein